MRFIDLLKNVVWTEQDILNRVRSVVNAQVPEARQSELQTILLGHVANMRQATTGELVEIQLVKTLMEQSALDAAQARTDMALLQTTLAYEDAISRLARPEASTGDETYGQDVSERAQAQSVTTGATPEVLELYALRNPEVQGEV